MIRERAAADLPACVEMLRAVHENDGYPSRWPQDPAAWLSPEGLLAAWVAEAASGRIAGHVALRRAAAGDDLPALWNAAGTGPDRLALACPAVRGPGGAGR